MELGEKKHYRQRKRLEKRAGERRRDWRRKIKADRMNIKGKIKLTRCMRHLWLTFLTHWSSKKFYVVASPIQTENFLLFCFFRYMEQIDLLHDSLPGCFQEGKFPRPNMIRCLHMTLSACMCQYLRFLKIKQVCFPECSWRKLKITKPITNQAMGRFLILII